jgi:hypothetical protein
MKELEWKRLFDGKEVLAVADGTKHWKSKQGAKLFANHNEDFCFEGGKYGVMIGQETVWDNNGNSFLGFFLMREEIR